MSAYVYVCMCASVPTFSSEPWQYTIARGLHAFRLKEYNIMVDCHIMYMYTFFAVKIRRALTCHTPSPQNAPPYICKDYMHVHGENVCIDGVLRVLVHLSLKSYAEKDSRL